MIISKDVFIRGVKIKVNFHRFKSKYMKIYPHFHP